MATAADLAELGQLWESHAWAPTAPRTGSLFGRVAGQAGRCPASTSRELAAAGGRADDGAAPRARRWAPELCGGLLPRGDLGTPAGRAKILSSLRRQEPIIISGAWELLPAARRWSVGRLQESFAGAVQPCHVLKAKRDVQKYTYYFKDLTDRKMPAEAMEAVPCNDAMNISFEQFMRLARDDAAHSYYLQTSLFARDPTKDDKQKPYFTSETLKADLEKAMNSQTWREITEAMDRPTWFRSQLFVGPVGTLGFGHFDQYDNVFMQVRGTKRILLFDPRSGAHGLCPFPVHHPYDQRARLDLERPDFTAFPHAAALRGGGVEAVLRPGDAVFIPSHWWHHVESTSGSPDWCVSVNFWFDGVSPRLLEPPSALGPQLEAELARQVEYLAADALGEDAVGVFAAACLEEALQAVEEDLPVDDSRLPVLNYVLRHLALMLGPPAVRSFLEDFLQPERWRGLQKVCF